MDGATGGGAEHARWGDVPMIPIARPQMGEEEKQRVWDAMASGSLAQGPRVAEFEAAFAEMVGVPHAVATSSGTTALHLALLGYEIGPGDEVVTVPFTFIASANSVLYTGARPVFVDVREDDFTLDPDQLEAAITPRTKAVMPVSLYGQPADLPAIEAIAERHGLAVIEDAAQAHGAAIGDRRSGTWGAGTFSFYPTKNMTTGEGGMITSADAGLAGRVRLLREHGMRVRYHHEIVGYNFRMTDLAAAIGLAQLPKLRSFNDRRRAIAARYDRELEGVITPMARPGVTHVYHQYTIRVRDRDSFADRLKERGVGSAIYYPIPVHRQKPFVALGYDAGRYPVTDRLTEQVLSIPVHPSLTDDEVSVVIGAVNETAVEVGPLEAARAG
jgi:dTDP-4-amino-4,6-dideoxygalactose transaminase